MFEKIVERILKKYLAPYIDGISRDGLSILKGDLVLLNLQVKAEAFDFLKPYGILLKSGSVGRLNVQIPWRQLTQGKITIELENIAVAVARIQGDIPDDSQILKDNWQSKTAAVEKKLQELQDLAENAGGDENSGMMGRFMHRLAQNISIAVGGGVMVQGFDTKQSLSGGLLLEGLRVMSVGDAQPDDKVATLQKRIEITDIAAYVQVDNGSARYMLQPTRVVLSVNHRASNLEAKLELLNRQSSYKNANGCRLAVSQRALQQLAISFREMGAWGEHTQEVVAHHCQHVKTDSDSLQGVTYQKYTQLYRQRQPGADRPLSYDEEDQFQAIEEAVMSRHLARWRLEVLQTLKVKEKTTRRGIRGFFGGGGRDQLVEANEWENLQKQIREDQAHLADLDRPSTMKISIAVQEICLEIYDDSPPTGRPRVDTATDHHIDDQINYYDLVSMLDRMNGDLGSMIQKFISLDLQQPQTCAKVTPRVVADYERSEWSFGLCFGSMHVWCDNNRTPESERKPVLSYSSVDVTQQQHVLGQLEPEDFKDMSLSSKIRDNGTELISAAVNLPRIELFTSPQMLAVAMGIAKIDLPDPPKFGREPLELADETFCMPTDRSDWQDSLDKWKQEQKEIKAAQAKDSSLSFDVDVAIAAPQLTVLVRKDQEIVVDLGHIALKTDGEAKADNFKATLALTGTRVACKCLDPSGKEAELRLLEPISLKFGVDGKPSKGAKPVGDKKPLDIDLNVHMALFKFDVYPQAVHLILDAPKAYLAVLDGQEDLSRHRSSTAWSVSSRSRGRSSVDSAIRRASVAVRRVSSVLAPAEEEKRAEQPATESQPSLYTVRAKAAIDEISLGLFALNMVDRAGIINVAGLQAGGSSLPSGSIAGNASMKSLLIKAMGRPLLQLESQQLNGFGLHLDFAMQAEQPMTIALNVCPVQVEWRKDDVKAFIAAGASCAQPAPAGAKHDPSKEAEAQLDMLAKVVEAKVKEQETSRRSIHSQPRRSLVPRAAVAANDPSRQLAKSGLAAGAALPALAAEADKVKAAMVVDVKFGGLLIKLYREEPEPIDTPPAFRQTSRGPLVEWHVLDLTAKYESFENAESRVRVALDSFSIVYDGHCIIAPSARDSVFFESDIHMYKQVENGGPLHSVCFRGILRKLSIVLFMKHIDSIMDYVSSNITGALVQQAAEKGKKAMQEEPAAAAAESVALWNFFIESPVICLGRDEEMLRFSPQWDNEAELLVPRVAKAVEAEANEDDEFQDASEHPTPMMEELEQYITFAPGSIQALNTYEADGTDSPPSFFRIAFSQTNLDGFDSVGPASGSILKIDNWELLVRLDSATPERPMHVSVGLDFKPIICSLTPERLRLVLDCLQENVSYQGYFPVPPVMAPEGAHAIAGPSFTGGHAEEMRVQSMAINVRIAFEGLNVTLSRVASGSPEGAEPVIEPMLRLAIGMMRFPIDLVMYYDNVPPAIQLGVFTNSVTAVDLRPKEARASVLDTRLLELSSERGFCGADGTDSWDLLPDPEQGAQLSAPANAALMLLFVIASASKSMLRFELRKPRIFALLRLCTDVGTAMGDGFASSSMSLYPGPPVPIPENMPPAPPTPADSSFSVKLLIQEASLSMYTNYVKAAAPVVQVILGLSTELDVGSKDIKIKDVTLSELNVSRTEAAETEAKAGASSVQLFTLRSVQVAGNFKKEPRQELEAKVSAKPLSVRLTTGDIPHLVAALTGIGGDGPEEKKVEQTAKEESGEADTGRPAELAVTDLPRDGRAGVLRLHVRGLPGAPSLEGLSLTARFGDQGKRVAVPWGQPLLLSVPPVQGLGGVRKRVADGPVLQLALHGPAVEGGSDCLAAMSFPAELCAGRGLDGRRLLLSAGPFSEEAAKLLGTPAVAGRRQLELDLQARYEPSSGDDAVASGISALCATEVSFDDFVKPCEMLEEFLQESVPRLRAESARSDKRKSRRTLTRASTGALVRQVTEKRRLSTASMVTVKSEKPAGQAQDMAPLAVSVMVAIDGFDATFLDDCEAHVLPVLRLCLRAGGGQAAGGRPRTGAAQAPSDRASMIKFQMNPWAGKRQRQGLSLGVENYSIEVSYLNARAGSWEPFLEPWAVDFFYSAYPGLEHEGEAVGKAVGKSALSAKYQAATEITLMSFGPLNVNVTPQLCSLASFLLSNKEAYVRHLESPTASVEGASGARYRLLNMSGSPVCLAVIHPGQEQDGGQEPLDWRVFEPCSAEVPLDPLLGHRSTEEWRVMADETLACLVGLLPPGDEGGGAPRDPRRLTLSSTCDGLLTVPGAKEHAACEVLLPHPSHHLMLISGILRVFNHTSQALEVRFECPSRAAPPDDQPPHAAPMLVLPERLAFPPEIASVLRSATSGEGEDSLAPIRMQETSQSGATAETGPVPGSPDAQRLPPQYFCAAPLWAAGTDAALRLRLAGARDWSEPMPLGYVPPTGHWSNAKEDASGKPVLVPGTDGALLRVHSYRSRGGAPGAAACCTAMHICAPLRLLNATPVRLCFSFSLAGQAQKPIEVEAFSECDVSSELDPAQPFGLSVALADPRVDATAPGGAGSSTGSLAESPMVQQIFNPSQPAEEMVAVPVGRGDDVAGLALGVTISRGLAVRASCARWLVDRTGLGLRALCALASEVPSANATPLAQVDGHISLLDNALSQAALSSGKKGQPEAKFFLAVPGKDSWSAMAQVKLPDEESGFVRMALAQVAGSSSDANGYAHHVCLQSEAAGSRLTFGAQCQVISVLPQVLIYNQLTDDALVVRAVGDAGTEVSVPAGQNGGFLRWHGEADASSGKSALSLQFRPAKLAESCSWSTPISFGVGEANGRMALLLPPLQASRSKSVALEMFTAEVAERAGIVCLTVKRGSRCELQNYSCLVDSISLRPAHGRQTHEGGEIEEFSARSCETVEFAWPSAATESQLELSLAWTSAAGGSETSDKAPELRKPGHVVFPAPDGWQAVLVETGSTGDVCWMRVQDIIWTTVTDSERIHVASKGPSAAQLKVVVSISHVGLSLVSPKREQELLYAEIRKVAVLLGKWESSVCLEFSVAGLQVDCQLLDYKDCPVVFASRAEPALQCKVVQQLPAANTGVDLEILGVSINALELSVNEGFLSEVGEAVSAMLRPILQLEELGREKIEAWRKEPLGGAFEVPPPTPLNIDISHFTFMGLELHLWASMRLSKLPMALRGALGVLTVGSDKLSIQAATVRLDPEVFEHIYGPAPTVAKMILQVYWSNLLMSIASVLGRSTLLEIPNLPLKWGRRGVESGMNAVDFLLTRTANVFEICTLDRQYVRDRRPLLGQQIMEVKDFKTGVGAAGQHLAEGVMHVGDIVREPIEGAREAGAKGFAVGIGRGVMGTVVRPMLGVVYGVQSLSRGVVRAVGRNESEEGGNSSWRKVVERRRPPRMMYPAGAIREYVEPQGSLPAAGSRQ